MPLDDLFVVVLVVTAPSIGEDEAAERVSSEIGTMGVHLSSRVVGLEVNLCLFDETDDLDVIWGPRELNTLESTTGNETGAVAGLGTPGNSLVFGFTDGGGAIRRGPDAEI